MTDQTYLNFGHVIYTLDAATGSQRAVHGEFPAVREYLLKDQPLFKLDHYEKPDVRGTVGTSARASAPAGSIQLREIGGKTLTVTLQLDATVEITDKVYWELFFDVRPQADRANLYERGLFQLLVKPATGRVDVGLGPAHPKLAVAAKEDGRQIVLTIPYTELSRLGGTGLNDFSFAAALNHQPGSDQKPMSGGRGYLRWEFHADAFAYAFNNGWPRIVIGDKPIRKTDCVARHQ